MSLSEIKQQVSVVGAGVDASTNRFFNIIAKAISDKIEADTGLKLAMVGRISKKAEVVATLIGDLEDPTGVGDTKDKVDSIIQNLRNPSALIDMVEK